MKRWWGETALRVSATSLVVLLVVISGIEPCEAAGRRTAQRRHDNSRERQYLPAPSMETLSELAQAMGAAEFEHITEGKALVKRLIPQNSEPDLDVISHQGVIGKAGVDFPAYPNIPTTGFNCKDVPTGYYADLETDCQVFHICDTSRKISFLCPNGTIFSQSHLICDWWFKVDCASAPALYQASAEYYSNEQKKTQKVTQVLSKNPDLQEISSDASNVRAPMPRREFKEFPSTTERFLRHKQRLGQEVTLTPTKATARSAQALPDTDLNARAVPTAFEKRRKNLVQLIGNNFANPKTTLPTYTDASTYRSTSFDGLKEMQVAAESASFANSNNRQYLQDYNKNVRPYPVYTPNTNTNRVGKTKTSSLTTLFVFDKHAEKTTAKTEATTKRPTLLPYTKSYAHTGYDKHEPYTRPGVSLLKDYLERRKNESAATTTEIPSKASSRKDQFSADYDTVTKIPQTTRSDSYFSDTAPSSNFDIHYPSTNVLNQVTTEPNYQERRERLLRKLNLDSVGTTETTVAITPTEKYGKRPGLIVPPSLTPKTLHTLAIYYATALDNMSTTQTPENDSEVATTAFDEYETVGEDGLPALFTKQTINKYSKLFGTGMDNSDLLEEIKLDPNGTLNGLAEDLSVQQSQNPLSSSPQLRELAQVFTHALSAYLQDPVKFRKVLSDIRPTQPPFGDALTTSEENVSNTESTTTTINEEEEEILGFSDENKVRPALANLRESKAYTPSNVYSRFETETTPQSYPTEFVSTDNLGQSEDVTTTKAPFKCCGKISASYTTASTTVKEVSTTPLPYVNTANAKFIYTTERSPTTTDTSYTVPKYGGFQNNTPSDSPYGQSYDTSSGRPLNEYVENTNLPTAWGVDAESTDIPQSIFTNADENSFESKKIKPTTYSPVTTPVYFTETDSSELENEEELQRAHSQSFVSPQANNVQRQSKKVHFNDVQKPSENLEAPTIPDAPQTTTTTQITTTEPTTSVFRIEETEAPSTIGPEISSIFTSPDSDGTKYLWTNKFENWQSTVVLDPMTLNDGLSATAPQSQAPTQFSSQTTSWGGNTIGYTATTPTATDYPSANEQTASSSHYYEQTTPSGIAIRSGRLFNQPTSTESNLDLTTIAETVVEKAKEIMGEKMNATTTEKLMNVMKKTKSKTVKRLILLLVQTCDDDHNSTAEASKRALLEALMTVSQKDMDDIEKESTQTTVSNYDSNKLNSDYRRSDRTLESQEFAPSKTSQRSGKSINYDPSAINSLSNPAVTTQSTSTESISVQTTASNTTPGPFTKTTPTSRRGARKYLVRTSPVEQKIVTEETTRGPVAEARVAPPDSAVKSASDTRAIELLRSLYTIAAKWG